MMPPLGSFLVICVLKQSIKVGILLVNFQFQQSCNTCLRCVNVCTSSYIKVSKSAVSLTPLVVIDHIPKLPFETTTSCFPNTISCRSPHTICVSPNVLSPHSHQLPSQLVKFILSQAPT